MSIPQAEGIMVRAHLGHLRGPARGPDEWARANHAGLEVKGWLWDVLLSIETDVGT